MMNRNVGSILVAVAVAVSASSVLACERHAESNEAKNAKAVVANGDTKGCDLPCCAHAKGAADTKAVAAAAEKPCAAHDAKGCPKKAAVATAAVKAEPAKDAAPAQPAADTGTHR